MPRIPESERPYVGLPLVIKKIVSIQFSTYFDTNKGLHGNKVNEFFEQDMEELREYFRSLEDRFTIEKKITFKSMIITLIPDAPIPINSTSHPGKTLGTKSLKLKWNLKQKYSETVRRIKSIYVTLKTYENFLTRLIGEDTSASGRINLLIGELQNGLNITINPADVLVQSLPDPPENNDSSTVIKEYIVKIEFKNNKESTRNNVNIIKNLIDERNGWQMKFVEIIDPPAPPPAPLPRAGTRKRAQPSARSSTKTKKIKLVRSSVPDRTQPSARSSTQQSSRTYKTKHPKGFRTPKGTQSSARKSSQRSDRTKEIKKRTSLITSRTKRSKLDFTGEAPLKEDTPNALTAEDFETFEALFSDDQKEEDISDDSTTFDLNSNAFNINKNKLYTPHPRLFLRRETKPAPPPRTVSSSSSESDSDPEPPYFYF